MENSDPEVLSGVFLDSAVQGLSYQTATQSGHTDSDGRFRFSAGEYIVFSLGDLVLPEILASNLVTPLDFFEPQSLSDVRVANLARLLQSLDVDGNPANGIAISDIAADAATATDFASATFAADVANLVANSGSVTTALVTSESALEHLRMTLAANGVEVADAGCGSDHPLVGQTSSFQTFFHDVSGQIRIVDNCTFEVTQFNYDGLGPQVYFYGGVDGNYAGEDAFIIGPRLDGTVYQDASLSLKLPAGKSLDDLNGISVWCAEFDIDFGSTLFETEF